MNDLRQSVPEPLALRMLEALREAGAAESDAVTADVLGAATPEALAHAGLAALRRALAQGDDRSAAFDLLAADALITQACMHAATHGIPEALAAERFATLLEDR